MSFGEKLSRARKGRGLTQAQLGERMTPPAGVHTISRWEAEDPERARTPDADQIRELCRVLHVSADVLLERAPFELPPIREPAP